MPIPPPQSIAILPGGAPSAVPHQPFLCLLPIGPRFQGSSGSPIPSADCLLRKSINTHQPYNFLP